MVHTLMKVNMRNVLIWSMRRLTKKLMKKLVRKEIRDKKDTMDTSNQHLTNLLKAFPEEGTRILTKEEKDQRTLDTWKGLGDVRMQDADDSSQQYVMMESHLVRYYLIQCYALIFLE